jgi:hypothetical protein
MLLEQNRASANGILATLRIFQMHIEQIKICIEEPISAFKMVLETKQKNFQGKSNLRECFKKMLLSGASCKNKVSYFYTTFR